MFRIKAETLQRSFVLDVPFVHDVRVGFSDKSTPDSVVSIASPEGLDRYPVQP